MQTPVRMVAVRKDPLQRTATPCARVETPVCKDSGAATRGGRAQATLEKHIWALKSLYKPLQADASLVPGEANPCLRFVETLFFLQSATPKPPSEGGHPASHPVLQKKTHTQNFVHFRASSWLKI